MKASPNREQLLFLVTGGIILLLILVVVIFNMIRSPSEVAEENEAASAPKVKVGDRNPVGNKASWLTQVTPAPIFNTDGTPRADAVVPNAKPNSAAPNHPGESKTPGKNPDNWNPQDASALESARLDAEKPGAKDQAAKKPAPAKPAETHQADKPPMPQFTNPKNPAKPAGDTADGHGENPDKSGAKPQDKSPAKPTDKSADKPADKPQPQAAEPSQAAAGKPEEKSAKPQAVRTPPRLIPKGSPNNPPDEEEDGPAEPDAKEAAISQSHGRYLVQVASYTDSEHASALATRLAGLMFEGKRMPVHKKFKTVGGKRVWRVVLGPFSSQGRAQKAAALAKSKTAVKGTVVGSDE